MKLFCVVIFATISNFLVSQYTLQGSLIPISDSQIGQFSIDLVNDSVQYHTHSGKSNLFVFTDIKQGTYSLLVEDEHGEQFSFNITIETNLTREFVLTKAIHQLNDVTVRTEYVKGQKIKVNDDDFHRSISELATHTAGVSVLSSGNSISKPIINGLHSNRVITIQNQQIIENQQWGTEHSLDLDVSSSQQVNIYKNSNALQFTGEAIGGIIQLIPEKLPRKDTTLFQLNSLFENNSRKYGLFASFQKGFNLRNALKTSVSYIRAGDSKSPDYYLSNSGFQTLQGSILYQFDYRNWENEVLFSFNKREIAILRSSHIGSMLDLYQAIQSGEPLYISDFSYQMTNPKQENLHTLFSIKSIRKYNFGNIQWNYGLQWNKRMEFDIRRANRSQFHALDFSLFTHQLGFSWEVKNEKYKWINGSSFQYQDNATSTKNGANDLIPSYQKFSLGLYTIFERNFSTKWKSNTGLRYDFALVNVSKFYDKTFWDSQNYQQEFGNTIIYTEGNIVFIKPKLQYHTIAFSQDFSYKINKIHHIKITAGLSNRIPNIAELFSDGIHHSAAIFEVGDLRLKTENSLKLNLQYNYLTPSIKIELFPYIQFINNFIVPIPTGAVQTVSGSFPVYTYQQKDALLYGIDFTQNTSLTDRINWKSTVSYTRGKNKKEDIDLPYIPPLNMKNMLMFRYKNISASVQHQFIGKQNRFPIYNFQIEFIQNQQLITKEVDVSSTPDSYHLFGLELGFNFSFKNIKTELSLYGTNIFNRKYRDYLNRMRYFADDLGTNIGLKAQFNF